VRYLEGAGPDPRCYRVNCDKLQRLVPGFKTRWTVRKGAEELHDSFVRHQLTRETFGRFTRLTRIRSLLTSGQLDASLYWRTPDAVTTLV